jgi:two-component system OmpR family sensor kinase
LDHLMQSEEGGVSPAVVGLLQRLLAIEGPTLSDALTQACNVVAEALCADKVDAFLHDPSRESLVAIGASTQPLSVKQRRLGLDVMPLANGGRAVEVFESGETYANAHVDADPGEVRGIREALLVRSAIGVPLVIGERRRGVMLVAALAPNAFTPDDARFAESIARWVGLVAHRAELLTESARSAAASARRQLAEELVTVLAHDLRNLLAPISSRFELLGLRARNEGRERDLRDAEGGLRTARRMDAFLGDMLDVTRLDHGLLRMESEPFDLAALVGEVCATFTSPELPVEAVQTGPVIVLGDRRRVRQCLENLTSNAVQHSPARAKVTVTVYRCSREGREWGRVEVRDQGVGVSPEVLPHIFQRFVTSGESRGLGLGLYLAKQIAVSHGGDLTVESATDRGTVFRLELPSATSH